MTSRSEFVRGSTDPADLVARARIDPVGVRREASMWLRSDDLTADERVPLLLACGWADYERSLFEPAMSVLSDAGELIDEGHGAAFRAQHVQASSAVLGRQGRFDEVAALAERAIDAASGIERAALRMMLAAALAEAGQRDGVLRQYDLALRQARRLGNPVLTLQLVANRAGFRAERDTSSRSGRALTEAATAAAEMGHEPLRCAITHNLGLHHARVGALPEALDCFAAAENGFRELGLDYTLSNLLKDQAEVLLGLGLLEEAAAAVRALVGACEKVQAPGPLVAAHGLSARLAVENRRYRIALEHAEHAHHVAATSEMASRVVDQAGRFVRGIRALVSASDSAASDSAAGDSSHLDDLTFVGGEHGIDVGFALVQWGHRDAARGQFELVASQPPGPVAAELDRTVAQACLADAAGATGIVQRAVHEGLALAEPFLISLGTSSTRARVGRRLDQLAGLGVANAYAQGDLGKVLSVLERRRRLTLAPEPSLTPEQRADIDELRRLDAHHDGGAATAGAEARYTRTRHAIEGRLRDSRTRMSADVGTLGGGDADGTAVDWPTDDYTIAYPFVIEDNHHALVLTPESRESGELRVVELGSSIVLRRAIRYARWVMHWSATRSGQRAPLDRVRSLLGASLGPLVSTLGDNPLVVISDPTLPPIPWSLISPTPVSEVSSMAALATPGGRTDRPTRTLVVEGAQVRAGLGDVAAIKRHMGRSDASGQDPTITILREADATAPRVLTELEGASSVHFAAHGRFRRDHPWFSELVLPGGSLRFFDLLNLERLPAQIVFAACDVGRSARARPQPLVAALAQRGCRQIVASSGQINDAATARFMDRFYQLRACGESQAAALHQSQVEMVEGAPSVAFFTSYGSPERTVSISSDCVVAPTKQSNCAD